VKTLFISPTTLKHLCNTDIINHYPYYHLKTVVIGTEAICEDTIKRAFRCLPSVKHFSAVYEMTEAGIISRTTKFSPFISHSCGTLCAGLSMMVIDMVSGVEVGINQQGLILLRGQTVISPYWRNDKATFEDFQRNGWRNTGDIGFYDKDGNVFLVDREKQMIKVDGFQVTPQELESILLTHPSIAEAAIVPATKVNQQETPVAFVVLKPRIPATAEQIKEFVNERVMPHKQVDVVVIAMTLPRSPGGKILWRLLREAANRKLRDYLQSIDAVRNDSLRVTLNAGNISIGHYNLKYQLHVYENITEPPKMGKLCHLKVFEIKELSNIFIENSEKPVNHIYWMCPPYGWCCGAECCQPFYRNPWPLLGPDFYELVAAITVFAGLLVIPELCRRLRKRKMDNTQQSVSLVVSTGIPGSIMENAEKAQFIA
ncbi:unnamed protein product, partial [Acanthocheilonema viteae]